LIRKNCSENKWKSYFAFAKTLASLEDVFIVVTSYFTRKAYSHFLIFPTILWCWDSSRKNVQKINENPTLLLQKHLLQLKMFSLFFHISREKLIDIFWFFRQCYHDVGIHQEELFSNMNIMICVCKIIFSSLSFYQEELFRK
jgi:hypothetical protein